MSREAVESTRSEAAHLSHGRRTRSARALSDDAVICRRHALNLIPSRVEFDCLTTSPVSLGGEKAMGSGAVDSSQWLSVKEETIFLHDGLIRVTDLAELPSEIGVSEQGESEQEVTLTLCIYYINFI